MSQPLVSVIIPTYNRWESLQRTLESLTHQTLSPEQYEVIVVDDGSSEPQYNLNNHGYPFRLDYFTQPKSGPTQARNRGAQYSQGEVLAFLDDDIFINPPGLRFLYQHCLQMDHTIVLGSLIFPEEILKTSLYARTLSIPLSSQDKEIHYTFCMTGLLAVRRQDFFKLGMFNDPTGGWPNWDDVDFGYRAHYAGYRLWICTDAIGEHWDYSISSPESAYNRMYRASKSAVRLFETYPELKTEIVMFRDSLPLDWHIDPPKIILRKLTRQATSTPLALVVLKNLAVLIEKYHPNSQFLRPLYRWTNGAYIYRGYQQGLKEKLASGNHGAQRVSL